jgi:hypothetical protein
VAGDGVMAESPTAWWCPYCRHVSGYDLTGDHEDDEGWCPVEMIEVPLLVPGQSPTAREAVLEAALRALIKQVEGAQPRWQKVVVLDHAYRALEFRG